MENRLLLWLWLLWLLSVASDAAPIGKAKIKLRILHTNDMHSRFEEVSRESGHCSEPEAAAGLCYGGFARLASLLRQARAAANASGESLFFLNAGDTYQGTQLYSHYKASVVVKFLNMLRPDVVSLGNHEFDDKVSGLLPFLEQANFPVVAANLDLSLEPELQVSPRLVRSHELSAAGGRLRVGVVGYLTPETALSSQPGRVRFLDEVASVREEASRLRARGCGLVIALGHSGYETDKRIAREVEEVDLVVGGHSNTFLWGEPSEDWPRSSERPPDRETPEGPYPTVVLQRPSGRPVYVVQAFAYTKYMGDLRLELNARGQLTRVHGRPVLVDARVPKDPQLEAELRRWQAPLENTARRQVGRTRVLLDGDEKRCRLDECNLGNLLTDAMIRYNAQLYSGPETNRTWTDAAVAIHQSGGIRSSINAMNDEKVTMNDILMSFPFGAKMYKVQLAGRRLESALEWSLHDRINWNVTSHGGAFLQMSGLQVSYDLSKPVGSRLHSVKVRCSRCEVPVYQELQQDSVYPILIDDFMYNGGDGFQMFQDLEYEDMNVTIASVVAQYINQTSPVYPGIEGRISFLETGPEPNSAIDGRWQRLPLSLLMLSSVTLVRFF